MFSNSHTSYISGERTSCCPRISNLRLSYHHGYFRICIGKSSKEPWSIRPLSDPLVNPHRWITNDSDCIISSSHSWISVPLIHKKADAQNHGEGQSFSASTQCLTLLEQRKGGSPDDFLISRNARPQKEDRRQSGRPPARGTRTIRICSFDARNRGSTRLPLKTKWGIGKTRAVKGSLVTLLREYRGGYGKGSCDRKTRCTIRKTCS